MADTVDTITLESTPLYHIVRLTNVSDATGESAVIKVDKSTLTAFDGLEPESLTVCEIRWAIQGFTSVRLLWDHGTDDEIAVLSGNGYENYERHGGLKDPQRDGTGDVLLTTAGAASGATYDITLKLRLKRQD